MSDFVSIEMLLDDAGEAAVRGDWERLAAAGMSSLGAHRTPSNRPHITLLVRTTLPRLGFPDAVARLPIVLALGEPAVFPHGDRGVLVRPVELTSELAALHALVHRDARAADPGAEDAPHTAPDEWTPHVTLARRLRLVELPEARRILAPPPSATGVALRRWDAASAAVSPIPPP